MDSEIIKELVDFLSIESVLSQPTVGKPFGEGIAKALEHVLKLGEKFGFKTRNYDNYIGQIDFGEGEDNFGVLCHIDVVPAGDGWNSNPFKPTVVDGKIYARGTVDDKSPAIAVLFAMKELKESGFVPKKRISLILGCDEESGWRDIEHYNKVAKMPEEGFSPDSDFPVINGEKGILHFNINFDMSNQKTCVSEIDGGTRMNVVAPTARVVCKKRLEDLTNPEIISNFTIKKHLLGVEIIARGKGAHACKPELGDNAIWKIFKLLSEIEPDNEVYSFISDKMCRKSASEILGINFSDLPSGDLKMNIGTVKLEKEKLILGMDIRYPVTISAGSVIEQLEFAIPEFAEIELLTDQKPLYVEENNPLVQKLLEAYCSITGDIKPKPKVIGGGTFARALKNGVSFGPMFETDEDVIHQPNEYITIDRVLQLVDIYKKALEILCG